MNIKHSKDHVVIIFFYYITHFKKICGLHLAFEMVILDFFNFV